MKSNYALLSTYICRNNYNEVLKILKTDSSIDTTYDKGAFFNRAVEDNNYAIVKLLLDHFQANQLEKCKDQYHEQMYLKKKMRDILQIAIEEVSISQEMQEVLKPYISFAEDSDHDQDLSGFDQEHLKTSLEDLSKEGVESSQRDSTHYVELTEEHLEQFNANNLHIDYSHLSVH